MVLPSPDNDKPTLRQRALAWRDGLPQAERDAAAVALADAPALMVGGKTISAYHAIGSELDPVHLFAKLAEQGAQLALPVLLDRQTMIFRSYTPGTPLVPVGFGTMGPDEDQPEVRPDLVLAPLAAFSTAGQRIGYGKGHYDRALAHLQAAGHRPALLGLAHDGQEVAPFAQEPHDIPLDGVLTPTRLRIFEHGHARLAPFVRGSTRA